MQKIFLTLSIALLTTATAFAYTINPFGYDYTVFCDDGSTAGHANTLSEAHALGKKCASGKYEIKKSIGKEKKQATK